jgi:hypothetical protein
MSVGKESKSGDVRVLADVLQESRRGEPVIAARRLQSFAKHKSPTSRVSGGSRVHHRVGGAIQFVEARDNKIREESQVPG